MTVSVAPPKRRLVDLDGLRARGITRHRGAIWRDIREGRFPPPIKIGARNYWIEGELDDWVAARIAERDARAAAVAEARA